MERMNNDPFAAAAVRSDRGCRANILANPTAIAFIGIYNRPFVTIQMDCAFRAHLAAFGASVPRPRDTSLRVNLGNPQPDRFFGCWLKSAGQANIGAPQAQVAVSIQEIQPRRARGHPIFG